VTLCSCTFPCDEIAGLVDLSSKIIDRNAGLGLKTFFSVEAFFSVAERILTGGCSLITSLIFFVTSVVGPQKIRIAAPVTVPAPDILQDTLNNLFDLRNRIKIVTIYKNFFCNLYFFSINFFKSGAPQYCPLQSFALLFLA
jgi:hypothetical protein